jgi:hypothetical protein
MRETLRYLNNAREILRGIPIENNIYTEIKPVREAFGTAYSPYQRQSMKALSKKASLKRSYPNQ